MSHAPTHNVNYMSSTLNENSTIPRVSRGAQTLHTGGIPRYTNTVYQGYPEVHKHCILRVSRGTQTLCIGGIPRYTNAAYQRYPKVHKRCLPRISRGTQNAVYRGYPEVHKTLCIGGIPRYTNLKFILAQVWSKEGRTHFKLHVSFI